MLARSLTAWLRPRRRPIRRRPAPPLCPRLWLERLDDRVAPAVGFTGTTFSQSGYIPPDTNGAIGPNHFVESVNGAFAIYSRTGTLVSRVNPNTFFDPDGPQGNNGVFDPRIVYSRQFDRWFATAMDFGVN